MSLGPGYLVQDRASVQDESIGRRNEAFGWVYSTTFVDKRAPADTLTQHAINALEEGYTHVSFCSRKLGTSVKGYGGSSKMHCNT